MVLTKDQSKALLDAVWWLRAQALHAEADALIAAFPSKTPAPSPHIEGEECGPIGDGTPHARMLATWAALGARAEFIAQWSDYSPIMSNMTGVIEYQAVVALDRLAAHLAPPSSVSKSGGEA